MIYLHSNFCAKSLSISNSISALMAPIDKFFYAQGVTNFTVNMIQLHAHVQYSDIYLHL